METKEYIITAESSQELIEEAVKALYTNGCPAHFQQRCGRCDDYRTEAEWW